MATFRIIFNIFFFFFLGGGDKIYTSLVLKIRKRAFLVSSQINRTDWHKLFFLMSVYFCKFLFDKGMGQCRLESKQLIFRLDARQPLASNLLQIYLKC